MTAIWKRVLQKGRVNSAAERAKSAEEIVLA
jgi:hypothetical protein